MPVMTPGPFGGITVESPVKVIELDDGTNESSGERGDILVDPSGNVWAVGLQPQNIAPSDGVTVKVDTGLNLLVQKSLSKVGAQLFLQSIASDTSGNIYVVGRQTPSNACVVAKYNSAGALQFQREITAGIISQGWGIDVDSGSGDIYVLATESGTPNTAVALKLNSSGVIQWQTGINVSGGTEVPRKLQIDSSNNVYITGRDGTANQRGYVAKLNSSGVLQWIRRQNDGAVNNVTNGIAINTSGDVYVATTTTNGAGTAYLELIKYNSSGTLQWNRRLTGFAEDVNANGGESEVVLDASEDIYVMSIGSSGDAAFNVAKYDSTGAIQFQRRLTDSATSGILGGSITLDSTNIYFTGLRSVAGFFTWIIAKAPVDGSGTGSYGTWDWEATSLTEAAGSLTLDSIAGSSAAAGLSDAAGTSTDGTSSLLVTELTP